MQNFKNEGRGQILLTQASLFDRNLHSLLIPISLGQSFETKFNYDPQSNNIFWRSLNDKGEIWFEVELEPWHFKIINTKVDLNPGLEFSFLVRKLLLAVRQINPHFLREGHSWLIETQTRFNLDDDFRAVSILVNNLAKWARVDAVELYQKCFSGNYDLFINSKSFHNPSVFKRKKSYSALEEFPNLSFFYENMQVGFFLEEESSKIIDIEQNDFDEKIISDHNSLVEKIAHQENIDDLILSTYSYQKFLNYHRLLPNEIISSASWREQAVFLPITSTLNQNLILLVSNLEESELQSFMKDSSFYSLFKLSNIADFLSSRSVLPNFFHSHGDYGFLH
ncbi:hypothetical protein N9N67_04385 [Bacteriovoracaceae bacterium]|nr:hypothetical protein [Bacteriovoracaceae bacterium]